MPVEISIQEVLDKYSQELAKVTQRALVAEALVSQLQKELEANQAQTPQGDPNV